MLSFILAVIAGYVTPMVEPTIKSVLDGFLPKSFELEASEGRMIAFAVMMLAVGLLALLFGGHISAFALILGGLLGAFAMRIYAAIMELINNRSAD